MNGKIYDKEDELKRKHILKGFLKKINDNRKDTDG
jgi:hypothetical protein